MFFKMLSVFCLLTCSTSFAGQFSLLGGTGFSAPSVNDKDDITNEQAGDIVLDSSGFWGHNGSTWVPFSGSAGSYTAPVVHRYVSDDTYVTPNPAPLYIRVQLVGGGGGGSSATTLGAGGTQSSFGTSLLVAPGGNGSPANANGNVPGLGGTAGTINSPAVLIANVPGSNGIAGSRSSYVDTGGAGGSTYFGGAGSFRGGVAYPGASNSGSGGSGINGGGGGAGGGAGTYVEAIIPNPSGSYNVDVGVGGTSSAAGAGGDGVVIVTEYYQ